MSAIPSKIYTVRSNARRDCRKLGLNPDWVIACAGGFRIQQPQPGAAMAKRDRLLSMLADWTPLADLMAATGWQSHTVRGALSTAAKAKALKIEHRRVDGVTSYRIMGVAQ